MGFFDKPVVKRPSSEPGEMEDIRSYQREQAIAARKSYQRVQDITHPTVKYAVPTAVDTTAASWFGPIKVSRAQIFTLLLNGLPTAHPVYALPCTPIDISVPTGCFIYSATGQIFALQVGEWYIYIPNQTGDPGTFNVLLTDASSELPAQQNALTSGGAAGPGGSVVAAFDSGNVSESALGQYVRAAITGQDLAAAAGAKNKPISSDTLTNMVGRTTAGVQALYTVAYLSVINNAGTGIGALQQGNPASASCDESVARGLLTQSFLRGIDNSQVAGSKGTTIEGRLASATGIAGTVIALYTHAVLKCLGRTSGTIDTLMVEQANASNTVSLANIRGLYVTSLMGGNDTGSFATLVAKAVPAAAGKNSVFARGDNALQVNARQQPADNCLEATAAINTAVTLTLPAPGVQLRQYIRKIEIEAYFGAALAAAAAPVLVTTTGIPGTPTFVIPTGTTQGQLVTRTMDFNEGGLEASADNATVTIVAPINASIIWRIRAYWYIA